ncbi:hypothetical protein [Thiohalophilus sp.]|uniref:hypothetical protein n=1 Tax=Thiohalophilus sp. TaxID=3028392 RepID=UPI002ACD888B|nr:hypothetical protein [Thiohalophilus sp.]MDZ7805433.1 hypothetical protein [Thiohalophilus sp.]
MNSSVRENKVIFGRILLLLGSVLALFALWRLLAPYVYAPLSPASAQTVLFLVIGGILAWVGYQLERRAGGGTDSHD